MDFNPKILILIILVLGGGCYALTRLAKTDLSGTAQVPDGVIDEDLYPTPDVANLDGVFGVGDGVAVGQGFPATTHPIMDCTYVEESPNTYSFVRTPTGMTVVYDSYLFACEVTQ